MRITRLTPNLRVYYATLPRHMATIAVRDIVDDVVLFAWPLIASAPHRKGSNVRMSPTETELHRCSPRFRGLFCGLGARANPMLATVPGPPAGRTSVDLGCHHANRGLLLIEGRVIRLCRSRQSGGLSRGRSPLRDDVERQRCAGRTSATARRAPPPTRRRPRRTR